MTEMTRSVDKDDGQSLVSPPSNPAPMRRVLQGWLWLAAGLALAVMVWVGYRTVAERRFRAELGQAERDFTSQRFSQARLRLSRLAAQWPGNGELQYRLGLCEEALRRFDAALAAWERVPAGSLFAAKAAVLRSEHLVNGGRYSPAESLLLKTQPGAGADTYQVERALSRLYRFEGRVEDVRHLLRSSLARSPDPADVLKELWLLDNSPMPVEAIQNALDHADGDDDRVLLGRARVAILTARYDEAAKWLDACLKRRPDDPAVWRGKLELALATGDDFGAWAACDHMEAQRFSDREILALKVWLKRGDARAERRALGVLIAQNPADAATIERLAALAVQEHRTEHAEGLRKRKAEIDRAKDQFRKLLLDGGGLAPRAAEFGRLSETLGRTFDARAWSLVATRGNRPFGRDALAEDARAYGVAPGETLAHYVANDTPRPPTPAGARSAGMGFVTPPQFTEEAESVGLRFAFENGATSRRQLPETMSGGVAVLDFDGDGWLDVYVVQGGSLDAEANRGPSADKLFHNNGDGTFRDVTDSTGLSSFPRDYGLGVTVGDFDNDGHPDLFITRLRSYALYRNRGEGHFDDATEKAGLAGVRDNPTSAAFADLDNDGDLDLYVCHYMVWDPKDPRLCKNDRGEYFYCDPSRVDPAPDHVFRNDGGRFVDVTKEAGFVDPRGRGLGVVAADFDEDGRVDLFVANDGTANYLFHNLGGFKFEEIAHETGVAGNAAGGYQAGMGVACGDLDGDGHLDLAVTNFYGESTTLYRNLGGGLFSDWTSAVGLAAPSRFLLGFGVAFLDYNNDGLLDLLSVNGHVNDNRPYYPYAMPLQLMAGVPDSKSKASGPHFGKLIEVSDRTKPPWDIPRVGRGLAIGDMDNDGRVDAIILPQNDPVAYLRNRTKGGHWLTLRLEGTRSNRDGVGARVTVTAGGCRQVGYRFGGGSYQSAGDGRLHFGFDANAFGADPSARIESVEVAWPSGQVDRYENLSADTGHLLREDEKTPIKLKGFP